MRRITFAVALLSALLCPTGPVVAQTPGDGAAVSWSDRPLRPGDIIRLRIWREPDMSGDFAINEEGLVVLPRIGRIQVVDQSPRQLSDRLVKEYERYLQQTSIEVVVLRRIQVLGAVRNPGLHPVDATMTVSDVLALAGGATERGSPDKLEIIRRGERIQASLSTSTRIVDSPIQSGDQIFVPERSWFSRNSAVIAAGLSSLLIAFLTRR